MSNKAMSDRFLKIVEAAGKVEQHLKSDVIAFNQPIDEDVAAKFHKELEQTPKRHSNVFFILTTHGGDPHAAYVIARELQLRYKKVVICIAGDCYSAGTLLVLCAHEVVIADRGRLGPMDIQIWKKDEVERLSSLTVGTALKELQSRALDSFVDLSVGIRRRIPFISLRTSMEMAADMTGAMYGEIYKQIDPIRIAADAMSLKIGSHYGTILSEKPGNVKLGAIRRLTESYPAHECIIDRNEADHLFNNLRAPDELEEDLLKLMGDQITDAVENGFITVLSEIKIPGDQNGDHGKHAEANTPEADPSQNGHRPSVPGDRSTPKRTPRKASGPAAK